MELKKLTSFLLSALLLFFNSAPALAAAFNDLQADHWAYIEIQNLTERGVIAGYPDETFKPENPVNRAEFTKMVIKTLDKDTMSVSAENTFTDINSEFWAFEYILRSKELGLVVGYPDNTFRPYNNITKAEATSIISKTVKDCTDCKVYRDCETGCEKPCSIKEPEECCGFYDCAKLKECEKPCPLKTAKEEPCVLKQFDDREKVANWARKSFKKAVTNELYVNHPDKNRLTPDKELTRAETAALLYKLRKNPSVLKAEFQGPEIQKEVQENIVAVNQVEKLKAEEYSTVVEHLASTPYTGSVNEVEITGPSVKILAHNVIPVNFEGGFKAKKYKEGELVYLTFTKNVTTEEGTKLIPAGSKLVAELTELKKSKLLHKNAKAVLNINKLVLPSGDIYPLSAKIENNELFDKKFGSGNLKKLGAISGTVATFGTMLGLIIGAFNSSTGDGAALGAIIGGGTGLLFGLLAPGCNIKIPEEQDIFVKLENDLELDVE